jgi:hypothetical protein
VAINFFRRSKVIKALFSTFNLLIILVTNKCFMRSNYYWNFWSPEKWKKIWSPEKWEKNLISWS